MPPKLSIITACLNAENTIRQTIESVLHQGVDGVEYIIIDGGSTDGTLGIINEYVESIAVIVSEPDQGISDAFNKGIALANGEYIGIINADDYYEPEAFSAVLAITQQQGRPDVVHGSLRYIPGTAGDSYLEHPDIERINHYMSVFHPTMFIRRTAYQSIGVYRLDYHYAMDSEWVHRAIKSQLSFAQSLQVISNMRLGGTSHKYMYHSLLEFRRSTLAHGANWFEANYYFGRQLLIQSLINIQWIKRALLFRRDL